jgi:CheY-like chemotaxis protein
MTIHVLVVDDHDLLRDGFRLILELEGYRVTTAADGRQALEAVAGECPDVVLTDIRMPDIDGWELRRRLLVEYPALPVIGMSSNPDVILEARVHRMNGTLVKPFHLDDLLDLLPRVLHMAA